MKNLSIAFFSLLTLTFASNCFAQPEKPFTIGGLIGESGLQMRGNYHDVPCTQPCTAGSHFVDRTSDYKTRKASSVSMILMGSYNFLENLGVEAQIATTLTHDSIFRGVNTPGGGESSMRVTSNAFGAYAVYKAGGDAFFKARLGLAISGAKYETDAATQSYSNFGPSFGLSIGQKFGPGSLEIMYMRYPDVKVKNSQFQNRFDSGVAPVPGQKEDSSANNYHANAGDKSRVTVRRDQSLEFFAIGYTYSF